MIGGPAGDEVDLVDRRELVAGQGELVEGDAMLPHATGEQALDRLGLLGDLLGHEVGVAAERGRGGVPVDVYGRGNVDLGALGIEDRDPPALLQAGELAVLELNDMRGDACEGRDVRGGIRPLGS